MSCVRIVKYLELIIRLGSFVLPMLIFSIATYAAETWTINKKAQSKLAYWKVWYIGKCLAYLTRRIALMDLY